MAIPNLSFLDPFTIETNSAIPFMSSKRTDLNNTITMTHSAANELTVAAKIIATSFAKTGGTAAQFLKADGSVDSSSYALASHNHTGTYAPLVHTHAISDITFLQTSLDAKANLSGASFTGGISGTTASFTSTVSTTGTLTAGDGTITAVMSYGTSSGGYGVLGTTTAHDLYIRSANVARMSFSGTDGTATVTAPFRISTTNETIGSTKAITQNSVLLTPTLSGLTKLRDIVSYTNNSSNQTGTIKITLPVSWTSTMQQYLISGYNYNANAAWKLVLGGYNYTTGSNWQNTSAVLTGDAPFTSVRFAHDGTKCCILLGTTSTVWQYPKITVDEVILGYNGISATWTSGWSITLITDETGITVSSTPTLRSVWHSGNFDPTTKANLSGATFTGAVSVALASGNANLNISGNAGTSRQLNFQTSGITRWAVTANSTAESGSNAGSAFALNAYDDSGALIDQPIIISRIAGGNITFASARIVTMGGLTAVGGTSVFGASGATSSTTLYIRSSSGYQRGLQFQTGSSPRWQLYTDNGAESGSDAGSAFRLAAYTDTAGFIDNPMIITRAAGGNIAFASSRPISMGQLTVNTNNTTPLKLINSGVAGTDTSGTTGLYLGDANSGINTITREKVTNNTTKTVIYSEYGYLTPVKAVEFYNDTATFSNRVIISKTINNSDQVLKVTNTSDAGFSGFVAQDDTATKFLSVGVQNSVGLGAGYGNPGEGVVRSSTSAAGLALIATSGTLRLCTNGSTSRLTIDNTGVASFQGNPVSMGALTATTADFSGVVNIKGGSSLGLTFRSNGITTEEYNGTDTININYKGYLNGTTQFRNFQVFDGKQNPILVISGSTAATTFSGAVTTGALTATTGAFSSSLSSSTLVQAPVIRGGSDNNSTLALGVSTQVRTGKSGSGYPFLAYNANATATANTYTYASTDKIWLLDLGNSSAFRLRYAPSGTAGNTATLSDYLTVSDAGAATFSSTVTATSFIKSGGTAAQFLKADGSIDSSTYYIPGNTFTLGSSYYISLGGNGTLYGNGDATLKNLNINNVFAANSAGKVQVTGTSTSWGVAPSTESLQVTMGTSSSATWLVTGFSSGTFRGGFQLLDSGAAFRLYAGSNYFALDANGLYHNTNTVITSANIGITTGKINTSINAAAYDSAIAYSKYESLYVYPGSSLTLREFNGAGAQDGSNAKAPRLGFWWYGRQVSSLTLRADGVLAVLSDNQASYTPFAAGDTYVNGTLSGSANIIAYSDERLKTNWRNLAPDFVSRLALVKNGIYDRTDQENLTQVGVSAQSLQTLMPEAVIRSSNGYLSVAYGNAALAATVELAKEIVVLREKVNQLCSK